MIAGEPLLPIHNEFPRHNRLLTWTIFAHPTDRPGDFVARAFICDLGPEPVPSLMFIAHPDIGRVRRTLAALGLVFWQPRWDGDEPQIVETWI